MKYTPIAIAIAIILAASASAQWTVVNLHPAGAISSGAFGIGGSQQAGYAHVGGALHASLWSGTAASWVDLHPAGATESDARDVHDGQQVGNAAFGGVWRASLWSGTAGTWVDLTPGGASSGSLSGTSSGLQVGSARVGGVDHASLWNGTAASWVDLHPAGSDGSHAYGVHGGQQAGYASFAFAFRASLWSGTAASWVNLNPAGSTYSIAYALDGGQQTGFAVFGGYQHAGLWTGTAASWVDLNPAGATESYAHGVHDGQQVGYAFVGGYRRASLWTGPAGSWLDLGAFLPPGFSVSWAYGISNDGTFTRVVGNGYNFTSKGQHALMWVSRAVAPTSYSMVRGSVFSGNLASLQNTDNNRLVMRPGFVFSVGEPPVQVRLNAAAPTASPNGFSFSVESSASFGNAQQRVWLWNYVIDDYELLDTRLATTTDDVVTVTVRTNPSRFIQPGTLAIRALVSYRAVGPAFGYPWSGRIDKVWWNFPG